MADPKNTPKGGHAGSWNGPDTEEGNYEKGKTRDKYRTAIPKQANQTAQKTQAGDPQRPWHRGNHINPEKTLTDTQHAEPTCNMDERGNNEANPDVGGIPLTQITEQGQQSCYSLEEEELHELEMQNQDTKDEYNQDLYLEHMKADRMMQIKNTMEYIVDGEKGQAMLNQPNLSKTLPVLNWGQAG